MVVHDENDVLLIWYGIFLFCIYAGLAQSILLILRDFTFDLIGFASHIRGKNGKVDCRNHFIWAI